MSLAGQPKPRRDGRGTLAIEHLPNTTSQVPRMVGRIASRRHGFKEDDVLHLVQALIVSCVAYAATYLPLIPAELDKVDVLLRKAIPIELQEGYGTVPGTLCTDAAANAQRHAHTSSVIDVDFSAVASAGFT
ncbi:hypothetical protein HPB49_016067 [Dermacentor silvarum]|uniref:Uncharacterized protein n=1 Tax=Dermacentor silvarum TaxID=543639 RepID=A0ACB8D6M9_DERSI|nr:hypothetical protein HPB49_016067 [Dermacentor silvarum]